MGARRVILISGASFVSLLCIALILSAVPVEAQESAGGIPPGTPARGSNADSPNSPPDAITIASEGCRVSEGASVTLADGDAAQPTQVRLTDGGDIEITETGGRVEITGPDNEDIYGQGEFLDRTDQSFDDTNGVSSVVASTGITGCAQTTGTARNADDNAPTDDGANGAARTTDDGADDQQYGDREAEVVAKTVPDKPLPRTGGLPLLVGAGLMALAATVLGARVIGRR